MKRFENLLWGICFFIVGIIVLLNSFEITNINIFFEGWWTLFIIIPSVIGLIKDKNKVWDIFFLVLGVCLFLSARSIISFTLIAKLMLPAILIIIGLNLIFRDNINSNITNKIKELNKKDTTEYFATFSAQKLNFDNQEFEGVKLNAIFGGIDLDLRKANITKDTVIDVSAIFGGVDIKAPKNVNVKVKSNSIFGGVDNKIENLENQNTIYINATCMFGGCDINE